MTHPSKLFIAAASSALVLAALVAPPGASAAPARSGLVASGLENPRQLTIGAGGSVYVAEAGRGGPGPCIPNPDDPTTQNCLGATGAVTKITRDSPGRIVTGLPSVAGPSGGGAQGPSDVAVNGSWLTVLVGLGGSPEARDSLGPDGARLGTVLHGRLHGELAVVADAVAHEAQYNPAGEDLDSNPTGLVALGASGQFLVVDAGANALESLGRKGNTTVAAFGSRLATAPWGAPIPMQSVPTDVVEGPDGALYVAELTGFPFPQGGAVIWRVVPGEEPTVYASGLTTVTALAWRGQDLYAVQLSDTGLLSGMMGSLRRVVPGGTDHEVVAGGLFAPYGVAIHGNTAYVSTCSVVADPIPGLCPDGGEVRAISLR